MDRRVVWLVVLLVAASGCVGAKPAATQADKSAGFQGTLRTYDDPTAEVTTDSPKGGFRGQVLNAKGAPLGSSHVTLLGTPSFMATGVDGRFEFLELEPKTYRLRVDPSDVNSYHSFEGNVVVQAGKIGYLDIVLEAKVDEGSIAHFHDRWENKTEIELVNGDFSIPPEGPLCNVDPSASVATGAPRSASDPGDPSSPLLNPTPLGQPMLGYGTGCGVIRFYPTGEKIVPPGTKELRVTIDWEKRDFVPDVTFKFMPPNMTVFTSTRTHTFTPGKVLTVPIDKPGKVMNTSDHGHQRYSLWAFQVEVVPRATATTPPRPLPKAGQPFNDEFVGEFQVKVVAYKGDSIPAEKPHERFWASGNSIKLLDGVQKTLARNGAVTRTVQAAQCQPDEMCFALPTENNKAKLVPPGTTRMKVTLKTTFGSADALGLYHEKSLAFRTAGQNYRATSLPQMQTFTPKTHGLAETTWELSIKERDTDPYYSGRSAWLFVVGHLGDERNPDYTPDCFTTVCGGETFKLTVEVFNDNWTPAYAA